jgi:molybdenum cofactor guanylyltransferase
MSGVPGAAAIILAGGKSTRLGRDKASEMLLDRPLLQHVLDRLVGLVDECVVVHARGQALPPLEPDIDVVLAEDVYPEVGPLGGIYTGLGAMSAPHGLVVACDMPLLQAALLRHLLQLSDGCEAVVPLNGGRPEPLCAVYRAGCRPVVQAQIDAGRLRASDLPGLLRTRYVQENEWRAFDQDGLSFQNVNRQEDLDRAAKLLRAGSGRI